MKLRQLAVLVSSVMALTVPLGFVDVAPAHAALSGGWTQLSLQNGWTGGPFGTSAPAVRTISGIVHFKGAITTNGTNPVPFTLPAAFRPSAVVGIPVDLCGTTGGRLQIWRNGVVTVQAQGSNFANAACFTSLDGAWFARSATSFTRLRLSNGWFTAAFYNSVAAVRTISGIVHLKGAIATVGHNAVPFTLPPAFRPPSVVFIPVDMCTFTSGRLQIEPSGVVSVEAEGGAFANAACFTSLDGASFATSAGSFTPLPLRNGWANAPFGTSAAAVRMISGVVHFEGGVSTTHPNPVPFILPAAFRPAATVYVAVDQCDATTGRLQIKPDGTVTVQAEKGNFSNAGCFTSLDGASFAP